MTFSPLPGTYASMPAVSLSTATEGAIIHYTTDGSLPTASSPVYSGAVTLSPGATIRAFAVAAGSVESVISGGIYHRQTAYQAWADTIAWNGADSSPEADPNKDGVPNLLAYALGGDPLADASAVLPVPAMDGDVLTLTYLRARAEVTYEVQTGTTLEPGSWTSSGVDQGSGNVGETIIASIPLGSGNTTRFLRLQVTL